MPRPLPNPSAKRSRAGSKRRAAGWMLVALGVLAAAVWVVSGWWLIERWSIYIVELRAGQLNYFLWDDGLWNGETKWTVREFQTAAPEWRFIATDIAPVPDKPISVGLATFKRWSGGKGEYIELHVALWPLPLLLWTTGGLALWSGRRARRRAVEGHCPTCGYNLAGLNRDAGGVCPECGKAKAVF